jgi:hypothetical protein
LNVKEAQRIIEIKLSEAESALNRGAIEPNTGNRKDHVFKIVCGAGKHSKGGRGILKEKIRRYLVT